MRSRAGTCLISPADHRILRVRITKGRDGPATLTCTRADGTSTWVRVSDYFPIHDIAHYTVETTLGIPNAFYSLVRDGWNIEDFAVKGVGAKLPHEANLVEAIVGRLQRDVMPGTELTTDEFNDEVVAVLEGIGNPARRTVTAAELEAMRSKFRGLLQSYRDLPPGESLALEFS